MPTYTESDIEQAPAVPQGQGRYTEADIASVPEQSLAEGLREFGRKMNPVAMAQGMAENINHPIEAVKRWGAVNDRILSDADDAFKNASDSKNSASDRLSWGILAARHGLNYVLNTIPGLGESLEEAGNKIANNDIAGGVADTAALGTQVAAGIKAPAIANAAGRAVSAAPRVPSAMMAGAKAAAPDVAMGAGKFALGGQIAEHMPGESAIVARFGLQYPGMHQVMKGIGKGFKAARSAMAEPAAQAATADKLATETAEAGAPAATTGTTATSTKTAGQLLYESNPEGTGGTPWEKVPKTQKAMFEQFAQGQAQQAAGAPPPSPTQSAPSSAQPAPAAPTAKPVYEVPTSRLGPKDYMGGEEARTVNQYRQTIRQGGQLEPIEGVMLPNGDINIVDGFHRTAAAKAEGVPAKVFLANEDEITPAQRASLAKRAAAPTPTSATPAETPPAPQPVSEAPKAFKLKKAEQAEYNSMLKSSGFQTDPGQYPGAQQGAPLFSKKSGQVPPTAIRKFPSSQLPALAKAEGLTEDSALSKLKDNGWSVLWNQ